MRERLCHIAEVLANVRPEAPVSRKTFSQMIQNPERKRAVLATLPGAVAQRAGRLVP